ncbi:MAG: DUF4388 domain-containing protein [Desulforhopalus sp.]
MVNKQRSKVDNKTTTTIRSFNGDLSLVSAVNLFQLIKFGSLSGHLIVYCEENSTHFIFTEGKLNYAFSRQGRKPIGQTLLESELITNKQLKTCLEDQKAADQWEKLGSIIVKRGYVKQSQITDIFNKQLKSALFETMTWTEGKFRFTDTSPLVEGDVILEEDIEPLILKGLIMLDEEKN